MNTMSRWKNRLLAMLCGAVMALGAASDARADYISIGSIEKIEGCSVSGSSNHTDVVPVEEQPISNPILLLLSADVCLGLLGNHSGSTTGMGSVPSSSSSAPSYYAEAETPEITSGTIVSYLVGEPGLLISNPFQDGIFHPPRQS